jgi:zinc finger HIT domain-containing protein 1
MPLIEELPVTTTIRASHGWTYVPDTGAPIAAVQLSSRKRGRDGATIARSAAQASKQAKATQQRLHDLNKENYREANIPIPKRDGTRGKERKLEPNVKRILAYQRNFQHYLANEEAGINVYGSAGILPPSSTRAGSQAAQPPQKSAADSKRRSTAKNAPSTPAPKGGARRASSLRHSKTAPVKSEESADAAKVNIEMTDVTSQHQRSQPASPTTSQKSPSSRSKHQIQPSSPSVSQNATPAYDPALDRDPLLRTLDMPKMPSDRVMRALLAEPPLSYTAASAKPLDDPPDPSGTGAVFAMRTGDSTLMAKPERWFCAVCGYWGKVRCKYGCGERVCGLLDCWRGHESVCSAAATAY